MAFTLRPTIRSDFDALHCLALVRVKAVTGIDAEGNIIGFGGVAYLKNGQVMAFTELTEKAKESPVSLHKAALKVIRDAQAEGIKEMVALADYERSLAAGKWLARLGFCLEERAGKTMWVWKAE